MRMRAVAVAALMGVAVFGVSVRAADLVSLAWGEFRPNEENALTAKSVALSAGANELNLAIELGALTATAEGQATEGSASYAGEVAVQQPDYLSLPAMHIELKGQVVKTEGTEASIEIVVGNVTKTIDWPADKAIAENFSTTIDADIPGGQIPAPFPVSAKLTVKKPTGAGASLLSLQRITVKIGQQRVATVQ